MISLEYAAGFFDGEGTVSVGSNGSVSLRVVNTNYEILLQFVKIFGGSIKQRKQMVNKTQYLWSVYGDDAITVAKSIAPFCIEKRQHLTALIEYASLRAKLPTLRIEGRKGAFSNPERDSLIKEYKAKLTEYCKGNYETN